MTILPKKDLIAAPARPQPYYRDLFYAELMQQKPNRVLDVGCGSGHLLQKLVSEGVEALGVEPDADALKSLISNGLNAQVGTAERLPYRDGSIDFVVSEFSAHHFNDFGTHIAEAYRVAGRGILILDQWYDETIPESALAARFDRWCKSIDSMAGEVHQPYLPTGAFYAALRQQAEGPCDIAIQTQNLMCPFPLDRIEAIAKTQLLKVQPTDEMLRELDVILEEEAVTGMADDGAVIVRAMKAD